MLSRHVTSFFTNFLGKGSSFRNPWKIERCQFHTTNVTRRKKKKRGRKGEQTDGPKMIKPENCADVPKPILEPSCKNALVIGGSEGFGLAAADHLLCKGARNIIIADDDCDQGEAAAKMLCDTYGKGRAYFLQCDVRNLCHFEAGLKQALNKLKVVHILFNNLDKDRFPTRCMDLKKNENYTARTIRVGMKILEKNHGDSSGIIVNCASIFGFLGWPKDPFPIYCKKEPVIEVTMDFARENNVEETGVRMVALCPTNKLFSDIGLPSFPDPIPNKKMCEMPLCIPNSKHQIGAALIHVLAWAKNGSTWLVEPAISVHKVPRLIHFPAKKDEGIDPKLYEAQTCTVKLEPPCVDTSQACKSCKPMNKKDCKAKEVPKKK